MKSHPNKRIQEAIEYALSKGGFGFRQVKYASPLLLQAALRR